MTCEVINRINSYSTFFQFTMPIINIPVEFRGNILSEKIGACLLTGFTLPHELGHSILAKYYLRSKDIKILLANMGGLADQKATISQEAILALIPSKLTDRILIKKFEDLQDRIGVTTAAGPITSAIFQSANLALIAKTSLKPSPITFIRATYHALGLLNEINYAITSAINRDKGDFGQLRLCHRKHFFIAAITLVLCAGVGVLSIKRMNEKWRTASENPSSSAVHRTSDLKALKAKQTKSKQTKLKQTKSKQTKSKN